jgi:hypothetical protein
MRDGACQLAAFASEALFDIYYNGFIHSFSPIWPGRGFAPGTIKQKTHLYQGEKTIIPDTLLLKCRLAYKYASYGEEFFVSWRPVFKIKDELYSIFREVV